MIPGKLYKIYTELANIDKQSYKPRFFKDRVPTYKCDPTNNIMFENDPFIGWISPDSIVMFIEQHENSWELLHGGKKIFVPLHHKIMLEEIK